MKKVVVKKEKDILKEMLLFTKENNGFMVVLLILLGSILFLQLNVGRVYVSEEKANYTLDMYTNNQAEIDAYLNSIDEELVTDKEDILDDYFLASARADFIWMRDKERDLFNSKPNGDLYSKEAAFSTFLLKIIELNEAFSVRIGEPEYDSTIVLAKNEQISIPLILNQSKIIELFEGDVREANVFSNTLNYLFIDYIEFKRQSIMDANTIEEQYVDSKKLLLVPELSEYVE